MSMEMTNAILRTGDQVKINGYITDDAKRFWIGLGRGEFNQALHISSRFSDGGVIVLNSRTDGCWGQEIRVPNPLKWGTDVEIVVKLRGNLFELEFPDGQAAQFQKRDNMEILSWIKVAGGMKLQRFEIC